MNRETPQQKQERQIQQTRQRYGGRISYSSARRNSIADFEDKVAANKAKREREESAKAQETPAESES